MICAQANDLMQRYADGELAGPRLMEFTEHLGSCEACGATATRLGKNAAFLTERLALLRGKVEPNLAFLDAATSAKAGKPAPEKTESTGGRRIPPLVPVAAILVILAVVGWWAFLRGGGAEEGTGEAGRGKAARPKGDGAREPGDVDEVPAETGKPRKPDPKQTDPRKPFKPVPVRANLAQLLPQLVKAPSQLRLEKVWAAAAGESGAAERILGLIDGAKKEPERVVLTLALAGALEEDAVRERLDALLENDGSARVRSAAAAALGHVEEGKLRVRLPGGFSTRAGVIQDEGRRNRLVEAASVERDPGVLAVLIEAIGPSQAADPAITARILELTRFEEPTIRKAALDSLRYAEPKSVEDLMFLVEDDRLPIEARSRLVDLVPGVDREEGTKALVRHLEVADDETKIAVLTTLARYPTEHAVEAATGILRDQQERAVRLAALGVVTAKPNSETRGVLEQIASEDGDDEVREAVKVALKALPKVKEE